MKAAEAAAALDSQPHYLERIPTPAASRAQRTEPDGSQVLEFSPDGRFVAVGGARYILIREAATGRILNELDTGWSITRDDHGIKEVRFSADGKRLYAHCGDALVLWEADTGKYLAGYRLASPGLTLGTDLSPDGRFIAYGVWVDGVVQVVDAETGRIVSVWKGPSDWRGPFLRVWHVRFLPSDPDILVVADNHIDGDDHIGLVHWRERRMPVTFGAQIAWSAITPDGRTLVAKDGERLRTWNLPSGELKWDAPFPQVNILIGNRDVNGLALSPDGGSIIAIGVAPPALMRISTRDGSILQRATTAPPLLDVIQLNPTGDRLLAGDLGTEPRLWDTAALAPLAAWAGKQEQVEVSQLPSPAVCPPVAGGTPAGAQNAKKDQAAVTAELKVQLGPSGRVKAVAFSRDGHWALTGGLDKSAMLWDVATGREIRRFQGHSDRVTSVAFSPDSHSMLTASWDNTVRLWDLETAREIRRFEVPSSAFESVAFSPDGRSVLTGSEDQTARLWDLATGHEIRRFEGHSDTVWSVAFSPDGKSVVTASDDQTARLWDVGTGREIRRFKGHSGGVQSAAFSPDGRSIVTGGHDETARLWNTATGSEVRRFRGHTGNVKSVAFSPDGRLVLTGSLDETARVWDAATGRERWRFEGHTDGVTSVAFSPDGYYALTGSDYDRIARLWDLATGLDVQRFGSHGDWVTSVAFSPDGHSVLTGSSNDHTARLWDLTTGRETQRFAGHTEGITSIAFSRDGHSVLSGSTDQTARLRDAVTGREIRRLEGDSHSSSDARWVESVAISPDGRYVLTGSGDFTARLWDLASGHEIRSFEDGQYVRFSDDGRDVLTGTSIGVIGLWDVATGGQMLNIHTNGSISSLALSSDGRSILVGFWANYAPQNTTVWLWDVATGREIRPFKGHSDTVRSVALSPDGHYALTGSEDKTARLWDLATGCEVHRLEGHSDAVVSVAFSPDGRFVLTGSQDGSAKIWDARAGLLLATLVSFRHGGWAVVDPDGRFDTSDLDGGAPLHWIVDNDRMRPLPLEIFMRDYYRPRLLPRILNGDKLPPLPSIAELNLAQPIVRMAGVQDERRLPGTVVVTVEVESVQSPVQKDFLGQHLQSGVYDVRLFRDGQMVGQWPELPVGEVEKTGPIVTEEDRKAWRKVHELKLNASGKGTIPFHYIRLPQRAGVEKVRFTAYAFNSDRVKSLTTPPHEYGPPAKTAATIPRRAYLITMGVNANQSHHLDLELAVSSAERVRVLLRSKLHVDYPEVIEVPLYSDHNDDNQIKPNAANKADLRAVLDLLAGRVVGPSLRDEVDSKHELRAASPNDAVVLYVASHGYADPQGTFYLMPYDTGLNWGVTEDILTACRTHPDQSPACKQAQDLLAHSVSSADLASWWTGVDAGEPVMILDSCHSGAAPGKEFRPGPLGDPGLGQLSYDKGMQILSASQPAQTAQGDWLTGGEGRTLLVDALETVSKENPQQSLEHWLHGLEEELPRTAKRLHPELKEEDAQVPVLLDFAKKANITVAEVQ